MTTGADNWLVRPYRRDDIDGAMNLIAACYGSEAVDRERWLHDHFGNPDGIDGTMVAEAGSALIGMQPMTVNRFSLDGADLTAGVLTGVMVDPDWRRRGVFLRLLEACEHAAWAAGAALVTTMPNDRSRPGFIKRGYVDPGERTLLCLPIGRGSGEPDANWRTSAARTAFEALATIRGSHRFFGLADDLDAESVDAFGDDADRLSRDAANSWPGLFQHRSSDWLTWRYPTRRWSDYRRWRVDDGSGAMTAFAVSTIESRNGLRVGYLVDVLGRSDQGAAAAAAAACRDLRDSGVDLVLSVVSAAHLVGILKRVGFVRVPRLLRPKRFHTVFRPAPDSPLPAERLGSIQSWYQTLGDWDTI